MAYREVTVLEVKEVLRLWLSGVPKKRIARQLGFDAKTVRRYLAVAQSHGLVRQRGPSALDPSTMRTSISSRLASSTLSRYSKLPSINHASLSDVLPICTLLSVVRAAQSASFMCFLRRA